MIRSLFSGVSGMKSHQIRMDVIGNNISNVNTTGYKSARCNFQDLISQNLRSASAPTANTGGVNPGQVGLGVAVAGIASNMQQGALQTTGRILDVAIQGNGYFIIKKNSGDALAQAFFSREGIFYVDANGYLVNSNGYYVCDNTADPQRIQLDSNPQNISTISISDTGEVFVNGATISRTIGLASFPNDTGLNKAGQNLYQASPASGAAAVSTAGAPATALANSRLNSGYLEMSNVDLTDEFVNMITTQRGYQANARTISTSDQMLMELLDLKR